MHLLILQMSAPKTVFAPRDAAFSKLPAGTLTPENLEHFRETLANHVLAGKIMADEIVDDSVATTLANNSVYFDIDNDEIQCRWPKWCHPCHR